MAENLTIARPYAQAVFDIAKDKSQGLSSKEATAVFDQWSRSLEALACAVSDTNFAKLIQEASSSEVACKLVIELLGDLLDDLGQNFVRVLGENNRLTVAPEIYQEFIRLKDDYLKIKAVEIISARKLSDADAQAIIAKLEAKYQAQIAATQTVDPSILGGLIIKIGDEVIDGSVRTSLSSLSSTLK